VLNYIAQLLIGTALLGGAAMVVSYLSDEAGILHVAAAGLMGVGAYAYALLVINAHFSLIGALAACIPIGAGSGVLVHAFTHRLRGSYLAMAFLSVAVLLHGAMVNWVSLTGGPMGLVNVPELPLPPMIATGSVMAAVLMLGFGLARLRSTTFGARVRAVRDDEVLSRDLRLQPGVVRLILITGSSSVLSILGALYGSYLKYLDPSSFALSESIAILAMAFAVPLNGPLRGLLGAAAFMILPEALRFLGLPSSTAAQLRELIFGFALFLTVASRKSGTLRLRSRRANVTSE
jgi:branched-chain amino acid transport system permease protein